MLDWALSSTGNFDWQMTIIQSVQYMDFLLYLNSEFGDKYFTHVIIDEAAQCSECEAMIPISCINLDRGQVIMAGDPLQLPPISLSNHARHYKLVKSMLERYIDTYRTLNGIEVVCF